MAEMKMKSAIRIVLNGLCAITALWLAAMTPAQAKTTDFDHLTTGFPLTGGHAQLDCETCHLQGVFKGTPRECERCHVQGSARASSFKPANHVQTTRPCNQCHTSNVTWLGARFDHIAVVPGGCPACHNGVSQAGKPSSGHPTTTLPCDSCHRTTAWVPAYFDHSGVAPHTCTTCHGAGQSQAVPLPSNHLPLGANGIPTECDWCHRAGTTWAATTFNHSASQGVVPGGCNYCHNGVYAQGQGAGHPVTGTQPCDDCHKSYTPGWPFTHPAVSSGCSTCHYGSGTATKYPGSHFLTTGVTPANACEVCHTSTATWTSTKVHGTSVVPGQCLTCHGNAAYQNSPYNVIYRSTSHTEGKSCDDAGCHQHTATQF